MADHPIVIQFDDDEDIFAPPAQGRGVDRDKPESSADSAEDDGGDDEYFEVSCEDEHRSKEAILAEYEATFGSASGFPFYQADDPNANESYIGIFRPLEYYARACTLVPGKRDLNEDADSDASDASTVVPTLDAEEVEATVAVAPPEALPVILGSDDDCPPEPKEDPATFPRHVVHPETTVRYKLRASPATRYMLRRAAVLFQVPPTETRKSLLDRMQQHPVLGAMVASATLSAPRIQVGYQYGQTVGIAVACPATPEQRSLLMKHLPGDPVLSRLCWEDIRYFYRDAVVRNPVAADAAAASPVTPNLPRKLRTKVHLDANLLAQYIDDLGGYDRAPFVCVDMEAACLLAGGHCLPVEIALYGDGGRVTYHTFVHPGFVPSTITASMLSLGMIPGSHGIPYKNCSFLRKDYAVMAAELKEFFVDRAEELIFIFKGTSENDINAIRWMFSAANADEQPIPTIHMFDIMTLARAMGLDQELVRPSLRSYAGVDVEYDRITAAAPVPGMAPVELKPGQRCPPLPQDRLPGYHQPCPYHARIAAASGHMRDAHCALTDAQLLFHRVEQLLAVRRG